MGAAARGGGGVGSGAGACARATVTLPAAQNSAAIERRRARWASILVPPEPRAGTSGERGPRPLRARPHLRRSSGDGGSGRWRGGLEGPDVWNERNVWQIQAAALGREQKGGGQHEGPRGARGGSRLLAAARAGAQRSAARGRPAGRAARIAAADAVLAV